MTTINILATNSIVDYFKEDHTSPYNRIDKFSKDAEAIMIQLMFAAVGISKTIRANDFTTTNGIKNPHETKIFLREDAIGELKVLIDESNSNFKKTIVNFHHDHSIANTSKRYGEVSIPVIPFEKVKNTIGDVRRISTLVSDNMTRFKKHFERLTSDFESLESIVRSDKIDMRDYDKFYILMEYYRSITRSIGQFINMYTIETTRFHKSLVRYIDTSIEFYEEERKKELT